MQDLYCQKASRNIHVCFRRYRQIRDHVPYYPFAGPLLLEHDYNILAYVDSSNWIHFVAFGFNSKLCRKYLGLRIRGTVHLLNTKCEIHSLCGC